MKVLWWLQNDTFLIKSLEIKWQDCPLDNCMNGRMHTSVLWWWWRPLSLWCDAGQSPFRWSCQCHRSHCQWIPPCQRCWDGRNSWPHLTWSYLNIDENDKMCLPLKSLRILLPLESFTWQLTVFLPYHHYWRAHISYEVVLLRTVNFGVMDLTSSDQVCQQLRPLCSELVGTCQTAITSNHTQVRDAQLD